MPAISMFYGIVIYMFFYDNKRHSLPHLHASYSGDDAIYSIEDGDLLEGQLPKNKHKLVQAWIEIHKGGLDGGLASGSQRAESSPYQAFGVIMNKVVSVRALQEKKVAVVLSDGRSGVFDVAPYIRSEFFERLNDDSYFSQVGIFFTGIGWPEGQDLGPDTIAAELQPVAE